MTRFTRHIFICINERADGHPRGCCVSKGGKEVAQALKLAAYDRGLKGVVRVNKAGCLDTCEFGVSAVVYPEAVWYRGITVDDVDEIVEKHLIGGEVVERLVLPPTETRGSQA